MTKSAMVMAAGLGTRMRPLTDHLPKPLVMLGGKPLIDYTLDRLAAAGVGRIIVNVHYLPDQIEAYLVQHSDDFEIVISDERALLLETGGGLIKARSHLCEDPFFCVNSDNIWTENGPPALERLTAAWDAEKMDALLLLVRQEQAHHHGGAGDFFLHANGQIERRGERARAPFIYTGVQLISHRLLRDPPEGPFSTNILWTRAILEDRLYAIEHDGEWFDIGRPEAIAPTEARLSSLAALDNG